MQFLRSIKSVKALGLAAATAATMIIANVAPSVAQTSIGNPASPALPDIRPLPEPALIPQLQPGKHIQRPGAIEFTNKGAYLVDYFVSYNLNNNSSNLSATSVSLSQKNRFEIPAAATNLQVEILYLQAPNQRKPLLSKTTIPYRPGQTICFTTIGTIFNPQFNNTCK